MEAPEVYKLDPHGWMKHKSAAFEHCRHCGLVALRNPISALCIKLGCNYDLHPRFRAWLKRVRAGQSAFIV